jgi:acid stress chaperone HdeB
VSPKPDSQPKPLLSFEVYQLRGTPAKFVALIEAADELAAIAAAAEQFKLDPQAADRRAAIGVCRALLFAAKPNAATLTLEFSTARGTIMLTRAIAFMVICSVTLLMTLFPAVVDAQVTVDITKITCRQFLVGNIVPTKSMAIWFSGYYSGKRGATMIEMSAVEPNADKMQLYCGLHQDEMLVKAIEDVFGVK